ncbi:MAG: hypothetical protein IJO01_04685 [Oscillospiraceae bacterium]|nr:hypothetical protein [Oscillospiraceae bacterium]
MIISKEQRNILNEYIKNLDALVENDCLDQILEEISKLQLKEGFTDDQEWLTPFGLKLQEIYDDIYLKNETVE